MNRIERAREKLLAMAITQDPEVAHALGEALGIIDRYAPHVMTVEELKQLKAEQQDKKTWESSREIYREYEFPPAMFAVWPKVLETGDVMNKAGRRYWSAWPDDGLRRETPWEGEKHDKDR